MQPKFTLKKKRFFLKLPAMLLLCFLLGGNIKVNSQCTWTNSTVYPNTVLDQAVVGVGNNLYSFAGVINGAIVATSFKFDGTTWTPIAATPAAVEYPAAVTDGTNIYVMGGASTTGAPTTSLWRYNVATDNYTTLASYTVGTWNQGAQLIGGKIYKFGGTITAGSTNVLEIYDIATNTWSLGAPLPANTSFPGSFVQGGFLYVVGGLDAATTTATAKTYRYDPAANSWNDAAIADLPATRWGPASGFYNGGAIVAGGYVGGSVTANISTSVLQWDPLGNAWNTLPNLLSERSRVAGGAAGGAFWVVGGRSVASAGFVGTNSNQRLFCVIPTPCTGTPTPGGTVSTASPVCPTQSFTLSPQNITPGSGVTYQWQTSPDNVNWTDVNPGGQGSTLTTTQSVATWYRVKVTCSGNTGTSTGVQVGMNPVDNCYCTPIYTNGCTLGDYIARVQVGTINNATACTGQYTSYVSSVAPALLFKGLSTTITVTLGPDTFGQHFGVWVDFNHDGDFNATNEFIGVSTNVGANGVGTMTINVPTGAATGITRLRVRGGDDVPMTGAQACGATNSTFGEAEDYAVDIQTCVQGVVTANPVSVTAECSGTASFTGAASGSALTYSWEQRINSNPATPWTIVTNGGTAPLFSGATTPTLSLSNIPSTYNGYNYRMVVQGPCTAMDFTTPAVLTMGPLVARTNVSNPTICSGSLQQLTLTNATSPQTVSFSSGAISIPVPDGSATPTLSNITVSGIPTGAVISNVTIHLNMAHTYPADMIFNLKTPAAAQILNLFKHNTNTDNGASSIPTAGFFDAKISSTGTTTQFKAVPTPFRYGQTAPAGPYVADLLNGVTNPGYTIMDPTGWASNATGWNQVTTGNINGTWTLAMADGGAGDVGTLTGWSIDITYGASAQGVWTQTNPATPPNTMFTDAAGTVAYTGVPINTIYVKPTVNTTYCVNYSTTNPACTAAPTCVTVNVTNPIASVTVSPATNAVCLGASTTFTAVPVPVPPFTTVGPVTYRWQLSIDDGLTYNDIAGVTSATLNVNNVTQLMNNYRYKVIATAPSCGTVTSTNVGILNVKPLPAVTLTASDLALIPGQTATLTANSNPPANSATSYVWRKNGVVIPGANTSTIVVGIDDLGTYTVAVTANNLCTATSNEVVIGSEASDKLWLYPNPSTGQFQVRLFYNGAVTENRVVRVYNSNGQLIAEKEVVLTNATAPYARIDFDLTKQAAGPYVVKVSHKRTGRITSGILIKQTN